MSQTDFFSAIDRKLQKEFDVLVFFSFVIRRLRRYEDDLIKKYCVSLELHHGLSFSTFHKRRRRRRKTTIKLESINDRLIIVGLCISLLAKQKKILKANILLTSAEKSRKKIQPRLEQREKKALTSSLLEEESKQSTGLVSWIYRKHLNVTSLSIQSRKNLRELKRLRDALRLSFMLIPSN